MIPHKYTHASDNLAQYVADHEPPGKNNTRQEVTADWYMEHMSDKPLFAWTDDETAKMGMDPWRLDPDLDDCAYRGWRLFVQRKDMPEHLRTLPHDPYLHLRAPTGIYHRLARS